MSTFDTITLQRAGNGRVTVLLDRPDSLNTLTPGMKDEIETALDDLRADDDVRVVVLRGRDGVFCAGSDVSGSDDDEGGGEKQVHELLERRRRDRAFYRTLDRFPKPIVAAIEGYALGAGCEIACCCDTRVAAESANIGLPEAKLGGIPNGGGTQRLTRLVGASRARDMVMRGKHYAATEMAECGFVHELAPEDEFEGLLESVVGDYLNRAPIALAIAKQLVTQGADASLESGLVMEGLGATAVSFTEDVEEGMAAFREDRDPEFRGR
ncbi:enoyl-CoA hydratase/isomerase family protein [Haloglomus litoreum]|uniref:enoyl-CoA hydratase/isomerase family protein n=1 Tax=Haloglomus litoreum TaxID=3034026 RepID=UPI0023E7FB63|nr:enoyl-CoA hydratase-related protein [Haloglomus sp. DT116]